MRDLTKGSVVKSIVLFGLPLYLGDLLQQLYIVADSIIVGQFLGTNAVAAVGVSQPVYYLLISFFLGVSIGFSIYIAYLKGAQSYDKYSETIGSLIIFTVLFSVLCNIIGFFFVGDLFRIMNVPKVLFVEGKRFLQVLFLGMISNFGIISFSAILRGLGDSKTPLFLTILSSLLNIVLVYITIVLCNGGIAGAALATVISQTAGLIIGLIYVKRKYCLKLNSVFKIRFSLVAFKSSIKFGMPLAVQQIILAVGIIMLVGIVSPLGASIMAGFTIAGRIELFTSMPFLELSGALTTFIAQNFGAQNNVRIKQGLKDCFLITIFLSLIISTSVMVFHDSVARVFSNDKVVVDLTVKYIMIVYPFLILYSLMAIMHGALNGIGKTTVALICTLISFLIFRIPLSLILRNQYGVNGLIWSVVIGWLIGLVYTVIMTVQNFKKDFTSLEEKTSCF